MIQIAINGQGIQILPHDVIVADAVNFISFEVSFSDEWDGLNKYLCFELNGFRAQVLLDANNRVLAEDKKVYLTEGIWKIHVFGEIVSGTTVETRITTARVSLPVAASGFRDGEPFPSIGASVGEQIVASEAGRVTAEEGRVTAEEGRVTAEESRASAEIEREATMSVGHNAFNGLQGGTTDEYYHLTEDQIDGLHAHGNKTALDAVSGTNTGDQDVSGAISAHNSDAAAHSGIVLSVDDKFKVDKLVSDLKISDNVSLRGYQGNNSAYISCPVTLNGIYDVEFLCKASTLSTSKRLFDFRLNSGVGYVSQSSDNSYVSSSGTVYVDKINWALAPVPADTDLHLIEVKGMSITATTVVMLAAYGGNTQSDSFLSCVRIYNHDTGDMLYEWLLNETSGTVVYESNGSAVGSISNSYAGLYSELSIASIPYSYRYAAWRVSRIYRTECLITHDDGNVEMLSIVAPLLESKGMVANVGVVASWVTNAGLTQYMRLQDLITLRDEYGFGIVNHTQNHVNLATADSATALSEISLCQEYLNSNGLDGNYLFYPGSGGYIPSVAEIARGAGIKVARRPSVSGVQNYPPVDTLALIPISTNTLTTQSDLDSIYILLDKAVATRSVVMTYNHNVQDDATALAAGYVNTVGITSYTKLINRLSALNVEAITLKEWYKRHYETEAT